MLTSVGSDTCERKELRLLINNYYVDSVLEQVSMKYIIGWYC